MGLGEGLGTNILLRFGLRHPNRVLGLVLVDPIAGPARPEEHLKYTVPHPFH